MSSSIQIPTEVVERLNAALDNLRPAHSRTTPAARRSVNVARNQAGSVALPRVELPRVDFDSVTLPRTAPTTGTTVDRGRVAAANAGLAGAQATANAGIAGAQATTNGTLAGAQAATNGTLFVAEGATNATLVGANAVRNAALTTGSAVAAGAVNGANVTKEAAIDAAVFTRDETAAIAGALGSDRSRADFGAALRDYVAAVNGTLDIAAGTPVVRVDATKAQEVAADLGRFTENALLRNIAIATAAGAALSAATVTGTELVGKMGRRENAQLNGKSGVRALLAAAAGGSSAAAVTAVHHVVTLRNAAERGQDFLSSVDFGTEAPYGARTELPARPAAAEVSPATVAARTATRTGAEFTR